MWWRAGRIDEALEECAAVKTELGLEQDETDDACERAGTFTVATFVRNVAIAGNEELRNSAEAFADDE